METVITAVYEHGLLRPLTPLPLQEKQTVRLQIIAPEVEPIIAQLVLMGVLTPPQGIDTPPPLSAVERQALADRLAAITDQPLSAVILAERSGA